jgi:ribosomal protein S18 acetylase RimI-like enzyme
MVRDLTLPIPPLPAPAGIDVRHWQIEGEDGQQRYLAARNACLPSTAWSIDALQFLVTSPLWREGTSVTAFAGDAVAGSVLAYWDATENARSGRSFGYTEEVFVMPQWRGRGLGRCLLGGALRHLRAHGLGEAELQVSAVNDSALGLYRGLGYQVAGETWHLGREV